MKKPLEYNSWPLPETLTRKVVYYLDVYRLIIAVILSIAHFSTLTTKPELWSPAFFASIVLVLYISAALFYLAKSRDDQTDFHLLARL